MNKDASKVMFCSPASGDFVFKFVKFTAKDGETPAPITKMGKKNKPFQTFGALLEVISGKWKGTQYYFGLYYNFGKDEDGNLVVTGTGTGSDKLTDFLDVTGVFSHDIKYSENALPAIQEIAQNEDRSFKGIVVRGWVETLIALLDTDEDWDNAEVENEFPSPQELLDE